MSAPVTMPTGIGVIDTMLGIPSTDKSGSYNWLRPLLRDRESLESFEFPVQYRDRPDVPGGGTVDDMIEFTVEQMDKYGIARALLDVDLKKSPGARAIERYPERFFGSFGVDPNDGAPALRELQQAVEELGVKAASVNPCFVHPRVPINDKRMYPVYAKCCELDIPVLCTTGKQPNRIPSPGRPRTEACSGVFRLRYDPLAGARRSRCRGSCVKSST